MKWETGNIVIQITLGVSNSHMIAIEYCFSFSRGIIKIDIKIWLHSNILV